MDSIVIANNTKINKKDALLISLIEYFCKENHYIETDKILNEMYKNNYIQKKSITEINKEQRYSILNGLKNILYQDMNIKIPLNLGTNRLHEFKIIKIINETHNATIYKVLNMLDKKEYCLKKVICDNLKILREIENLASFEHKNILRYYSSWIQRDFESDELCLYILTELCEYDLEEYLTKRKLSDEEKIKIINQIIDGVKYIHNKNIIHRDIKLQNIFIKENEDETIVKIGDFGLSKMIYSHSLENKYSMVLKNNSKNKIMTEEIGTELYASPEQLEGKYDIKSDIYSLGLVICMILSKDDIIKNKIKMIENYRNMKLDEMTPEIVIRMINNEPSNRPSANEIKYLEI
jgi:serine/threonine protein kinase